MHIGLEVCGHGWCPARVVEGRGHLLTFEDVNDGDMGEVYEASGCETLSREVNVVLERARKVEV